MQNRTLYFAYGSNLNMEHMAKRCPDARVFGQAILPNYRMLFRANGSGRGVADIEPAPGEVVVGGLWTITISDLKALDIYEGYPNLYNRKTIPVYMVTGKKTTKKVKALVYIMAPGHKPAMPSFEYLRIIAEGYRDFKIDIVKLLEAERITRITMKEIDETERRGRAWATTR